MFYYDRIDLGKGKDVAKSNNGKECMVCQYWLSDHDQFQINKFQNSVCNGCHDLTILCLNFSDIAIVTVKNVDYRCIFYDTSKSKKFIC